MVAADPAELARVTAWVRGRVQGVGFRWWTRARALELGLAGWARNLEDGRVEVVAQGSKAACEALLGALRGGRDTGKSDRRNRTLVRAAGRDYGVRGEIAPVGLITARDSA